MHVLCCFVLPSTMQFRKRDDIHEPFGALLLTVPLPCRCVCVSGVTCSYCLSDVNRILPGPGTGKGSAARSLALPPTVEGADCCL